MRRFLVLFMVLIAHRAVAQRADSAATARRLIRGAAAALQLGDTAAAADSVQAAARAWPVQSSYWLAAARWNALAGRHDAALVALTTLRTLGGGWRADDPRLATLAHDPRFVALPPDRAIVRSRVVVTLPDADFHPEGVAWDPRTQRLFVGSVHRGTVVMVAADSVVTPFIAAGSGGLRAVFGVLVDTTRNLLWISSADIPERDGGESSPRAPPAVYAFSLATGSMVRRWAFPEDGRGHLIGELTLAPDGTVWGSDSESAALYRVPVTESGTVLERLPLTHPDWGSLQGLAFSADGRTAWLADWTTGLYRIDLQTAVVTPVTTPAGITALGIDGLYRVGNAHFLAVQNGIAPHRIVAIDLDERGTTVRALRTLDHPPGDGEPTLGVVTPSGFLFVAGALWPFYDGEGRLSPGQPRPRGEIRLLPWR